MKVNCGPYIHGVRVRLGYSPNGGTIIVKTKAIRTKLAGKTIYKKTKCKENMASNKRPDYFSEIVLLCSTEERKSQKF